VSQRARQSTPGIQGNLTPDVRRVRHKVLPNRIVGQKEAGQEKKREGVDEKPSAKQTKTRLIEIFTINGWKEA